VYINHPTLLESVVPLVCGEGHTVYSVIIQLPNDCHFQYKYAAGKPLVLSCVSSLTALLSFIDHFLVQQLKTTILPHPLLLQRCLVIQSTTHLIQKKVSDLTNVVVVVDTRAINM
jgi:hypothetical protein